MEPDAATTVVRAEPRAGVDDLRPTRGDWQRNSAQPITLPGARSLGEDADGLIRDLFNCVFTIAGVQSHHNVSDELSDRLSALITVLDDAIRGIRHALYSMEGP